MFLDLDRPALDFVSFEISTSRRYAAEILESVKATSLAHREQIVLALQFLLPRFREGLQRQRGSWFGFGSTNPVDCKISSYDTAKLAQAPINNIPAEQSVGSINHELKRRGAGHLN